MEENKKNIASNRQWLYDTMKSSVDLGSFEDFSAAMDDENNRKWAYDQATKLGIDIGSEDDFNNAIWEAPASAQPAAQPAQPAKQGRKEKKQAQQAAAPMESTYEPVEDFSMQNNQSPYLDTASLRQPRQAEPMQQPSVQTEKTTAERNLDSINQKLAEDNFPEVKDDKGNTYKMKAAAGVDADGTIHLVATDKEGKDVELTGSNYADFMPDNSVEGRNRKQMVEDRETVDRIDKEIQALKDKDFHGSREQRKKLEAEKQRALYRLDNNPEYKRQIAEDRNKVAQRKSELDEALQQSGAGTGGAASMQGMLNPLSQINDREKLHNQQVYDAADRMLRDADEILATGLKYGEDNKGEFVKGAGRTMADPDFWTFGMEDTIANFTFRDVMERAVAQAEAEGKGETVETPLSPIEEKLVEAYLTRAQAMMLRADDQSRGSKMGAGAAESLKFMVDMAITGAIGKAMTKGAAEAFSKKYMAKIGSTLANMEGKGAAALGRAVAGEGKWLGVKLAGDLIETVPKVAVSPLTAQAISQQAAQYDPETGFQSWGESIGKGLLDAGIEKFSELHGGIYERAAKNLFKVAGAPALYRKLVSEDLRKTFSNIVKSTKTGKVADFFAKGGWDGMWEMAEEMEGAAAHELLMGEKGAWEDYWKRENWLEMAGSFAPMTIFGMGVNATQNIYTNRKLDKSIEQLGAFGFDTDALRERAETSSIADLAAYVSEGIEEEQKQRIAESAEGTGTLPADMRREMAQAAIDYVESAARKQALDGALEGEQMAEADAKLQEIKGSLQGKYFVRNDGTVQIMQMPDGEEVYVVSEPTDDGLVAVVHMDGTAGFANTAMGQVSEPMPLEEYLRNRVQVDEANDEAARMETERQQKVGTIAQQYQLGQEVTYPGADGKEVKGKVLDNTHPDVLSVMNNDGTIAEIPWEQVAAWTGQDATVLSDQEQAEAGAAALEAQDDAKAEMAVAIQAGIQPGEVITGEDGENYTVQGFLDDSIDLDAGTATFYVSKVGSIVSVPMTLPFADFIKSGMEKAAAAAQEEADRLAAEQKAAEEEKKAAEKAEKERREAENPDLDKLLDENPEEFARINDEQYQDGGADTREILTAKENELTAQIEELGRQRAASTKPSERKTLADQANRLREKITRIRTVLDSYNTEDAVEEPAPAPAPALQVQSGHEAELEAQRQRAQEQADADFPQIQEKWNAAPKMVGFRHTKNLPNGKRLRGHYVLTEADAMTPSHDPQNGYKPSIGFPKVKGSTVNDRDYEHDKSARQHTEYIAGRYNGTALDNIPTVTPDGVVIDGNGRTMASQIAARNGSDADYLETLREESQRFGFSEDQVAQFQHPRVVFVTDESVPYTVDTFAQFNDSGMKEQTMEGEAVKDGKILAKEENAEIVNTVTGLIGQFDTVDQALRDEDTVKQIYDLFKNAGVFKDSDFNRMFLNDKMTDTGKERIKNALLGIVFDEDVIRLLLSGDMDSVKKKLIRSMAALVKMRGFQDRDYDLTGSVSEAVRLINAAMQDRNPKSKDIIGDYMQRMEFVTDEKGNMSQQAPQYSERAQRLAHMIQYNGEKKVKDAFSAYLSNVENAAAGEISMFGENLSAEDSIKNAIFEQTGEDYGITDNTQEQGAPAESGEGAAGTEPSRPGDRVSGSENGSGRGGAESAPAAGPELVEPAPQASTWGANNKVVSKDRYEELKRRAKERTGQLNAGFDGELLAIVTEMAAFHIEAGARKFVDFAKRIIADLGDGIRNYLKSAYNGARDMPGMEDIAEEMDPYDVVKGIDVNSITLDNFDHENFDKATVTPAESKPAPTLDSIFAETTGQQKAETVAEQIEEARQEVDTNPTDAQKEAGNYRKGHVTIDGYDISIENPKGSIRRGTDANGNEWQVEMNNDYGYIRMTEGPDGDHIDVFLSDTPTQGNVFVVDQVRPKTVKTISSNDLRRIYRDMQAKKYVGIGSKRLRELLLEANPDLYGEDQNATEKLIDAAESEKGNAFADAILAAVNEKENGVEFDEHKVMYGFPDEQSAREAYLSNYSPGWKGLGNITEVSKDEFKKWIESSHRKTKPFAEYKSVTPVEEQPSEDFGGLFAQTIENQEESAENIRNNENNVVPSSVENVKPSNNTENGLQGSDELRTEGTPADSVQPGGGTQEAEGRNGAAEGQESGGSDSGRAGGSEQAKRNSRPRLDDSVKRNKNNNHVSKGEVVYPKTPAARYKANIAAIKVLRELQGNGKAATKEQMEVLRQYTGWGGLGTYFNNPNSNEYRELRSLLSDEEMQAAALSVNTAYYTPTDVIDAMWDIAKRLGFTGGTVLESSAGIGNILASMPTGMSERSEISAVELDSISGGILELLYPDANVMVRGFEEVDVPNGSVDLAITNVPFGDDIKVYDEKEKDLSRKFGGRIHDFFIAKNIRKLSEGGIGIFISTRGTMDNASKGLRQWIGTDGNADVIGAFRLNNATFEGTGATSDIIVVRKRVSGEQSPNAVDITDTTITRRESYPTGERKWNNKTFDYDEIMADGVMEINDYFVEHPENMGGEMGFGFEHGDTSYRPGSTACWPTEGIDQDKRLNKWVKGFSDLKDERAAEVKDQTPSDLESTAAVKEGQMVVNSKGEVCLNKQGKAVPLNVNKNKVKGYEKQQVVKDYDALKNAINEALAYQLNKEWDAGLKPLLDKLNKAYDTFVSRYGQLNKNTAIAFLRNDVDFSSVAALEDYKETKSITGKVKIEAKKTAVFKGRTLGVRRVPTPTSVKDGIIVSMNQFGRIDIPYIANALGQDSELVREEVLASGLGFEDPATGKIEVEYEYLSGNVREKLAYAREHNENGRYDANIKALEKAVPSEIPAHLIEFSLGSDWLPVSLYKDYAKEKFGVNDRFVPQYIGGSWVLQQDGGFGENNEKNRSAGVTSDKINKTVLGHALMLAAMNKRQVQFSVTYKIDGQTITEHDKEAAQAAATKIDEMRDDFKEWCRGKIRSDEELSTSVTKIYNDTFNAIAPKEISETFIPDHFEGQVIQMGGKPFHLYPHQAKAVVRGTTEPLMLAHEVGTGKTFTLITTAMEMRRLGTAKKPMIVVQNATLGQFVNSAKALYPNAKVLTITEKDHDAEGRSFFNAKIRYNDWDMIIVPQSVFEMIPDSEQRQRDFIQEKIDEKMISLQQAKAARNRDEQRRIEEEIKDLEYERDHNGEKRPKKSSKKDANREEAKVSAKTEAKAKANAAAKAKEQLDRATDDVANFDELGVDALLIDEAHAYKHLGFATAMTRGVKGVDPSFSKKSASVYMKTRAVYDMVGWKNVVFATGTPISNTAAEIWTFMKYLMPPDVMRDLHIFYFDDFVSNFGNISQSLEFTTSGKFKETSRFASYTNLPELIRIWSSVCDTVLTREAIAAKSEDGVIEKLDDKVPKMESWTDEKGEVHENQVRDIYLPQSAALVDIMTAIRKKLEWYESLTGKEKRQYSYIPLTMFGLAKLAAIDPRLVSRRASDEPLSKTNKAVEETLKALKDSAEYNGTAAIFCDNYQRKDMTPEGKYVVGFNLFEEIKRKLVEAGVPADQIVIMKSGLSDNARARIFSRVNSGEVRVIMGTTATLGTGVNIQERLFFEAHMDAPNRPMDYTQRMGRILRQGNLHKDWGIPVRVVRFGVEDSLDVTAYQRLSTKSKFINSIMEGKELMKNPMENRVLEEDEEGEFDTPVAVLSGSQFALLKSQAERELRKLRNKKAQYQQDQIYIENQLGRNEERIEDAKKYIASKEKQLAWVEESYPNGEVSDITIEGVPVKTDEEIAATLKEKIYDPIKAAIEEAKKNPSGYDRFSALASHPETYEITVGPTRLTVQAWISAWMEWDEKVKRYVAISSTQVDYSSGNFAGVGFGSNRVSGGINGIKDIIPDFIKYYASGKTTRDAIEDGKETIERLQSDNEQMLKRRGKEFADEEKLQKQEKLVEDYTEKMKSEMAEKEKKYAEMVKNAVTDFSLDDVEVDDEDSDEGVSYRMVEEYREPFFSIADRVEELADALGVEVNIIRDLGDIKTRNMQMRRRRRMAKGWYDSKTGKAYVVLPNAKSVADAEATVFHEVVGHYGMEKLFGEQFEGYLDELYENAEPEVKERIDAMRTGRYRDEDKQRREAVKEYIAEIAERGVEDNLEVSFWERAKMAFRELMRNLGIRLNFTDADIRYNLWKAKRRLAEGEESIMEKADRLATDQQMRREAEASYDEDNGPEDTPPTDGGDGSSDEGVSYRAPKPARAHSSTSAASNLSRSSQTLRDRAITNDTQDVALRMYGNDVMLGRNIVRELLVDQNTAVRTAMRAIEKESGKEATAREDITKALNQLSSKQQAASERYANNFLVPLMDTVAKVAEEMDVEFEDIIKYVSLRRALEANELYAKRDAKEYYQRKHDDAVLGVESRTDIDRAAKDALIQQLDADLQNQINDTERGMSDKYRELRGTDGKHEGKDYGATVSWFSDYVDANGNRTDIVPSREPGEDNMSYQRRLKSMRKPMAGADTLAGAEDLARQYVHDFETRSGGLSRELWDKINAATGEILRIQYESHLITKEQYDNIRDRSQYYVPLRGFADMTAEDAFSYVTDDLSDTFVPALMRAGGRISRPDSPFGFIAGMAASTINEAYKNMAVQALYRFIANRKDNSLAVISDSWYVPTGRMVTMADVTAGEARMEDLGKEIWEPAYPNLDPDSDVDAQKVDMDAFNADMEKKALLGQAAKGTAGLNLRNSFVFNRKSNEKQHFVRVKVLGDEKFIIFRGNPRAAQAINGILNPDTREISAYARTVRAVARTMAKLCTSYSVPFWFSNFFRDGQTAIINTYEKEGAEYTRKMLANIPFALGVVGAHVKGGDVHIKDSWSDAKKNRVKRLYDEYQKYAAGGAITGYSVIFNHAEYDKQFKRAIREKKSDLAETWSKIGDVLEQIGTISEGIEQVFRFATFITSREAGRPMEQCIDDAKNVTVNFNRKGSYAAMEWKDTANISTLDRKSGTYSTLGEKGGIAANAERAFIWLLSQVAPWVRTRFMFVNPNIQGTYTTYSNWKVSAVRTASAIFGVAMTSFLIHLASELFAPDPDDREKRKRRKIPYSHLTDYQRRSNIILPELGGVRVAIPLSQEYAPFWAIGDIMATAALKEKYNQKTAWEVAKAVGEIMPVNVFEPTNIVPDPLAPTLEAITNTNYQGRNIFQKLYNENTPDFKRAFNGTWAPLVDLSVALNRAMGGTNDLIPEGYGKLGNLPFRWNNPAAWQHIVEGMGGTTVSALGDVMETAGQLVGPEDVKLGSIPIVNRFVKDPYEWGNDWYLNTEAKKFKNLAADMTKREKILDKSGDMANLQRLYESDNWAIAELYNTQYKKEINRLENEIRNYKNSMDAGDQEYLSELQQELEALQSALIKDVKNLLKERK